MTRPVLSRVSEHFTLGACLENPGVVSLTTRRALDVPLRARALPAQSNPRGEVRKGAKAPPSVVPLRARALPAQSNPRGEVRKGAKAPPSVVPLRARALPAQSNPRGRFGRGA